MEFLKTNMETALLSYNRREEQRKLKLNPCTLLKNSPSGLRIQICQVQTVSISEQVVFPESVEILIGFPIPIKQLWARAWVGVEYRKVYRYFPAGAHDLEERTVYWVRPARGHRGMLLYSESCKLCFGGTGQKDPWCSPFRAFFLCSPAWANRSEIAGAAQHLETDFPKWRLGIETGEASSTA